MLYILLLATSLPLTPAFPPEPVGKPVTVQILDGYFVKNTTPIPPTGMAALILKDQETFDNTFQKVPPMGVRRPGTPDTLQKSIHLPENAFDSHVILAVATQAHATAEYSKVHVSRTNDLLRVQFKSSVAHTNHLGKVDPKSTTAVFVSPLIVMVPAKALEGVKSIEFHQEGAKPVVIKP